MNSYYMPNEMTGFYIKCNIGLKWVNKLYQDSKGNSHSKIDGFRKNVMKLAI